jgi:DNA-binding CsgD family transcriptional regulator
VKQKTITVVATLSTLSETYRCWILSFLNESLSIYTSDYSSPLPLNSITIFFILNEKELSKALQIIKTKLVEKYVAILTPDLPIELKNKIEESFSICYNLKGSIRGVLSLIGWEVPYQMGLSDYYNNELTPREKEVLELIAQGLSLKEISFRLTISRHTVVSYRRSLYLKTGARTLQQLVLYATLHLNSTYSSKNQRA